MKKISIIVITMIGLVVVIGTAVFFFNVDSPTSSTGQTDTTSLPVAQNTSQDGTSRPVSYVSSGDTSFVNNFLKNADTYSDPVNPGYYSLGYPLNQTTTGTSSPPYLIMYIETTQFFTIELLREPIGETRTQVELFLEQRLGLAQNDLCELNYTISAPVSVSQEYAGRNLGFSFCPGATILPK